MPIALRVMTWNIAEGHRGARQPGVDPGFAPDENNGIPLIAQTISEQVPDLVLLNEVVSWFGVFGGNMRQAQEIARRCGFPHVHWVKASPLGGTGEKVNAVLSRFPLSAPRRIPVVHKDKETTYSMLETTFEADHRLHYVYSLRFDAWNSVANKDAHEQLRDCVNALPGHVSVIAAGDFNAAWVNNAHVDFVEKSGLSDVFLGTSVPAVAAAQTFIDHIFFRGPYRVRRSAMADSPPNLSDHGFAVADLVCDPGVLRATFGSRIKIKHAVSGRLLHSHSLSYGHPGSSRQQQVTAFEGYDNNDLWVVHGPEGTPANFAAGQPVRHGDVIRLQHLETGCNLHSHSGFPSPVTRQQETTCYGSRGIGDHNDNWQIEIEGGGEWETAKRVRLIHSLTNHALHSHLGFRTGTGRPASKK